ncbi:homoserine O-acetyltransferase MetA [Thorsellia anophelis]|uniref:Homoserine O-succinyltransferase n=1 Tax=Thorsellia anophelis DSM 18579 TaxID=1123402 RepID=A0A1H9YMW3_9GAMM|nr:homoserine O-succinyltransferase [Thorsellia anophelis]SES70476.1 homoserine O-succinyltransferase [Thorsellia anophelis DSM 18579]
MPIRIPDELPAFSFLRNENVFVMSDERALTQEIRPLNILILNLMPKKIETENQFLRLLSNAPLQLNIKLVRLATHESKNTPTEHLDNFYCDFNNIKEDNFDGLIVTGAPLGQVQFNEVAYWDEIKTIIEWSKEHVTSTLFVCWAVQAALNILYGVPKLTLNEKLSGVYKHQISQKHGLLTRGFDDSFWAPHSRYAAFPTDIIEKLPGVELYAESEKTGAYLFASRDKRQVFVTGHPEYDVNVLSDEYHRDVGLNLNPLIPENYFPGDNPDNLPQAIWRSHAYLLFANWLNYYVYQITPYDLSVMNPTLE